MWTPRIRAGFTLIEIIVVVAIIGVAGVVIVPALAPGSSGGAATAAERLVAAYRQGREAAAARAALVEITFTTGRDGIVVVARGPAGQAADTVGRYVWPAEARLRVPNRTEAGSRIARFGPLGRVAAPPVYVFDSENAYDIHLDLWTGAPQRRQRR